MLSQHKAAKFQTHSLYLRTTVKVIAVLLFASYSYTLWGKRCKDLGCKSKDIAHGEVHIPTIQAADCGASFYWMRVGCTGRRKVIPYCKLQELTHFCNRNCPQFIQDIDSYCTTKERAFITYHAVDSHFAEQRTN